MYIEKNNLLFQKHAQTFLPSQFNSKMILQCLSSSEERALLLKKNRELQHQIKTDMIKIEKLKVTGRQFYKTFTNAKQHFKSQSSRIRKIKHEVDTPEHLLKNIARSIKNRNYQGQLDALEKICIRTPRQILTNINKKDQRANQLKVPSPKQIFINILDQQKLNSQDDIYEKMILQNPTVYKKIMMAYNASKRQLEKEKYNLINKKVQSQHLSRQIMQRTTSKNRLSQKRIGFNNQFRQFQLAVNMSNKLIIIPPQELTYKAYICRGNNGLLVKSLLKSRSWWSLKPKEDIQTCNLVWTQWKRNKSINMLPKQHCLEFQTDRQIQQETKRKDNTQIPQLKIKQKESQLYFLKKLVRDQKNSLLYKFNEFRAKNSNLLSKNCITQQKFQQQITKLFNQHTHKIVQKQHKIVNHIPGCLSLHSKKQLFYNLKAYYLKFNLDLFSVIPLTFHIKNGCEDPQFIKFTNYFNESVSKLKGKMKQQNIWICKPGQNSNRGNGITVLNNLQEIAALVSQKCKDSRTLIIQKYFQNPFLYNKRKFDIRCYVLITSVNGIVKGYWYEQGYLRTSSKEFTLKNLENKYVHLTNDAIQKKSEEYGKFQSFNKISYPQFQKYLESYCGQQKLSFAESLLKMKKIATDLINSVAHKLNPKRKQYSFELFGLDYMLDQKLNPFLIQANSNPCISVDGTVLSKIIPNLLQNVIRIAIDPVFPPPFSAKYKACQYKSQNLFQSNKFVLVYDSYYDTQSEDIEKQEQHCCPDKEDQFQELD